MSMGKQERMPESFREKLDNPDFNQINNIIVVFNKLFINIYIFILFMIALYLN